MRVSAVLIPWLTFEIRVCQRTGHSSNALSPFDIPFDHVLPKGFVRIRHFGCLANRHRTSRLALSRRLVGITPSDTPRHAERCSPRERTLWHCPRCAAVMIVIQSFTPGELRSRCIGFDSS